MGTLVTRVLVSALFIAALGWLAGRLRGIRQSWARALVPILRRLPHRLDRITEIAEQGALTVKAPLFADVRDERLVVRVVAAILRDCVI
ncbi:MAG TPA: hypothetical protein VF725_01355 [Ktedonobacterales bacterium]